MQGKLRIFLGAAPGVGKTYAMLEEAHRLSDEGHDVIVALVETHGRAGTARALQGLEQVPTALHSHKGLHIRELDVDAVIKRAPKVAVVDEFAHSNVVGSPHGKRWEDINDLLNAGIDVLSTINIQHIDSLNDVVQAITGIVQYETVPDAVLRAADQIELVDIAPQSLRDRLTEGNVYSAERIDAALSNYFRLGNLTALRELALLWLADEVDLALNTYRDDHAIASRWEARERVVVALGGHLAGETLVRRGARIAARTAGGELHAVHVNQNDGLQQSSSSDLAKLRKLVESLGGTFHQVVGDDIAKSLVDFAAGLNATQLVIGLSRRNLLQSLFSGSDISHGVIKLAGTIDVHIVNSPGGQNWDALHKRKTTLFASRKTLWGFLAAVVGVPLVTAILVAFRSRESIIGDVLVYQLLVILIALVGGRWPAVVSAILSGLALDFYFIQPYYTVSIDHPLHILALLLYVGNALIVSFLVDYAARRLAEANRAGAEATFLATVSGSVLRGDDALTALVNQTREAFSLESVYLFQYGALMAQSKSASEAATSAAPESASTSPTVPSSASATETLTSAPSLEASLPSTEPTSFESGHSERIPVGDTGELVLLGPQLEASNQRILSAIVAQIESVLEHRELAATAQSIKPLERNDQVRSALLSSVSHDLRRPLAAAVASVTALNSEDFALSPRDRAELLDTAQESLHTLTDLVTNLLDATRVQAGVLAVQNQLIDADSVIGSALDELGLGPDEIRLELNEELPSVLADRGLLQRSIVNILANAHRFSPADTPALVTTSSHLGFVEIRIIDYGPGIDEIKKQDVFMPFQRLGDTDNTTGLGLGLALSRGFVEGMGGSLEIEDTPGGGVTMVISLMSEDAARVPVEHIY